MKPQEASCMNRVYMLTGDVQGVYDVFSDLNLSLRALKLIDRLMSLFYRSF